MSVPSIRSDRGRTRLESSILTTLVIVGLLVVLGLMIRPYITSVAASAPAAAQDAPVAAEGPQQVSVVAPGTIALPGTVADGSDACPDLRGTQPEGFDCTLPLYVRALDLTATRPAAPYACPDPENYRLVRGQKVEKNKRCVLKTASAG